MISKSLTTQPGLEELRKWQDAMIRPTPANRIGLAPVQPGLTPNTLSPPGKVGTSADVSVLTSPLAQQMAEVNRINQLTPGAELRFTGPDRSMASLTLSPELEELHRLEVGTSADALAQIRSRIPLLEMGPITADPEYAKSFYERQLGLVRPEYERKGSELAERLANRGVPVGSDLYSDFFDLEVNRPLERATAEASLLATTQAGAEARANRVQALSELAQLMNLAKKETPKLTDFFAPSAVDVMGPARLSSDEERAEANRLSANEQASKARRAAEDAQLQETLISSAGPALWVADKMGLVEPIGEGIKAGVSKLGGWLGSAGDPSGIPGATSTPVGTAYPDYPDKGIGSGTLGATPTPVETAYDPAIGSGGVPVSYPGETTPTPGSMTDVPDMTMADLKARTDPPPVGTAYGPTSADPGIGSGMGYGADYADPGIGSGIPAESFAGLSPAASSVVLPAAGAAGVSVAVDLAQGKKKGVAKNAAFVAAGTAIGTAMGSPYLGAMAGKLAGEAFNHIFPLGGENTAWQSGQANIAATRNRAKILGLDPDMLVRESGANPTIARQIINSGRFPEAAAKLRSLDAAAEAQRIFDDSIGDM